ncbi:MAG: hypothetical protein ACTSQJ_12180 [Promethearchaeota archaeon]
MILKINNKSLEKFSKNNNWKGIGVKSDPIIIDTINSKKTTIILKGIRSYICIKNCNLRSIGLKECQYITIKNCNFINIGLNKCQDITISNCKFDTLGTFILCIRIKIVSNKLSRIFAPINCRELVIVNNEISQKYLRNIENERYPLQQFRKNKLFLKILLLTFSFSVFTTLSMIFFRWNWNFSLFLMLILDICLFIILII